MHIIKGFSALKQSKADVLLRSSPHLVVDYQVQSFVPDVQPGDLPAIQEVSSNEAYLQLPPALTRTKELSRKITSGKQNIRDKCECLKDYLCRNYQYDLEVTESGGEDSIEEFLFTRPRGYCMHFATAMVMMLRAVDVPSRLATGFLAVEYDEHTGEYLVRQRNAHAWTEVYFGNEVGWITVEPTPAVHLQILPPSVSTETTPSPAVPQPFTIKTDYKVVLVIVAVVGLLLLVLIYVVSKHLAQGRGMGFFNILSASGRFSGIWFYNDFLKIMARRGLPKPTHHTAREFARHLSDSVISAQDSNLITTAFYESKYGGRRMTSETIKSIRQILHQLTHQSGRKDLSNGT